MDLNNAMDVIQGALACYAEDCISCDPRAQRELDRAWRTLKQHLGSNSDGKPRNEDGLGPLKEG